MNELISLSQSAINGELQQTVVYQKGLDYISKILLKEGYKQFSIGNE